MQYFSDRRNKMKEEDQSVRVAYASFVDREEFRQLPRSFHCHDGTLELILAVSGSTVAVIDGIPWNAGAGDIIIYNRKSYHQEITAQSHDFSLYCVAASGLKLPGLPEDHICDKKSPKVLHTGNDFEMFRMFFSRIFDLVRSGDYTQTAMLDNYMKVLLGEVLLLLKRQTVSAHSELSAKKNISEEILVWLNDHYTEKVSLQRVAEALSLSPDYISHLFKSQIGYSPIQYVNYLRIGRAQIRLIETRNKIADIAVDVGFNNIGNFNRAFFEMTGLSPRDFRKAHTDNARKENE